MKISSVTPFFHHDSVVAYTDTVVDSLVPHHMETVVCDVDMTIVHHSTVVLVVVVAHPSYVEVSCDDVIVVADIRDVVAVVRTPHFPTPGRGILPNVDLVVAAMHHVMEDTELGIHGDHDHIRDGTDNNEMNL
jgi:hypothetical protein